MGFFDMFKKKEQKVQANQNKDPLADILSQTALPQQNFQQTQQTAQNANQNPTNKNPSIQQNVAQNSLPLPQIPTFNNVPSNNQTNVQTSKTDVLSSQTIPSLKETNQSNQVLAKKEVLEESPQPEKKESQINLTQKEYYFYKDNLFVDSKYYESVYSSLVDSMKMLQTYKKIIDVSLQREDFEDVMKNYYDSLDEMNRLLLKLDKSIFDD